MVACTFLPSYLERDDALHFVKRIAIPFVVYVVHDGEVGFPGLEDLEDFAQFGVVPKE